MSSTFVQATQRIQARPVAIQDHRNRLVSMNGKPGGFFFRWREYILVRYIMIRESKKGFVAL
jgi:hypothetical protein